ncbi:MAG TPA: sigma-70 family RNA polymerase sigma factor [Isosphaeraceae bacterium]|nr:sigma-70 family RNA polymerase sigma factor [Isosphaeraceae bacterium]
MSTIELLTGCGEGVHAAIDWAAALAAHDRWLRTVVLARLGEPQAVDEVIQEVSLAAVEQKAPVSDPSKVGAWLYQLAVRKALLYRRQRGRQHKLADRYARLASVRCELDNDSDSPLDWLLRNERRQIVLESLARLPRRELEILLLKYSENWSYRELAEHLGSSASAVQARLHRVRQRLRAELSKTPLNEACE